MSRAREASVGRSAAQQVEASLGVVDDASLRAYVIGVGQRIAAFSPRGDVRYRFDVVSSDVPNAFALPGGYIYVTRGLLALLNSEAELAGILGHEITHVAARHSAQSETRATSVGILARMGALAGAAIGGSTAGEALGNLGRTAGAGFIAAYSRDQEREADRLGQELAARAGYAPDGLPAALQALGAAAERLRGSPEEPGFFDSHPGTNERILITTRRATDLEVGPSRGTRNTRAEFLSELDGIHMGPPAKQGAFLRSLFVHPELGFAMRFPRGWRPLNANARVLAIAPTRDALIEVTFEGKGESPSAAASRLLTSKKASVISRERAEIAGMPAYRVEARLRDTNGIFHAQWLWIEHPAGLFRVTATTPVGRKQAYSKQLEDALASFREPTPTELSQLGELRLRIVTARAGEKLPALGQRAGNRWNPAVTARLNGLDPAAPLTEGFPVKVVVREAYVR